MLQQKFSLLSLRNWFFIGLAPALLMIILLVW
ncbi:MAG: hypothetical protein ACI8UP_003817, partial [Porticoccaceae bacterium]